jgi:adenylylsulfate kinase-like enzyme
MSAANGRAPLLTGVDAPYEPPEDAAILSELRG